jgi:Fe2+ transport system protein FeoA
VRVTLDEHLEGGTRMVIETTFPSTDAMERLLAMGMEEGMSLALGQIDDLLRTPTHQQ